MKNHTISNAISRFQQAVKNTIGTQLAVNTILALFLLNGLMSAQPAPTEFVSFGSFIDQTKTANAGDFMGRADSHVRDAEAFEEMRQHILKMYDGVEVEHSFMMGNNYYDCVPVEQQPAVRLHGLKVATPPPQSLLRGQRTNDMQRDAQHPFDEFGNYQHCEAGSVPLQRVTLDTTSRFETLRQFFSKNPTGPEHASQGGDNGPDAHKYSFTYQYVNNIGGNSNLNVWAPYVNTAEGEIFSLSQEWYIGGTGSSEQTEEVGWVVYPGMFGDEKPHLFIFSTTEGYQDGCWDNSCGDFVVSKDGGVIGAPISPVSTSGGTQYEVAAQYLLYKGNWWMEFQGTWIGYYPGSMYHGGQNSKYAQLIEFGTEGVGSTIWPPEGSGAWPSKGFGYAAYQRNLLYYNLTGGGPWDSLTPDIPSPHCYSIAGPYSGSGKWTVYFFEGGPGGTGC